MNKEKDEDLDNLFKKGLEDPVNEAAFRDADWDAMEQMLDSRKKRPAIIYWLPILGSVAALLLIFLGWLFFKADVVKPVKQNQVAVTHSPVSNSNPDVRNKENTGTSGGSARQTADNSKHITPNTANTAKNPVITRHGEKSKSFFTLSGADRRHTTGQGTKSITAAPGQEPVVASNIAKIVSPDSVGSKVVIANNITPVKKDLITAGDHKDIGTADAAGRKDLGTADAIGRKDVGTADAIAKKDGGNDVLAVSTVAPVKTKVKGPQKLGNRPQFALGIIASSDLNGVNSSFQQTKVGGNFGATFAVTFGQKWTVSTGAMYAIKPYLTNFNNYHTAYKFPTQPSSVNANCRMLDIPLNINYQVYKVHGNKITLGSGLSSYFMLREDYKFNYSSTYVTGPSNYTVINKNKNILSVLNLDATYEHQISSKVGVTIQPYLKVPLSDVGASQVRLQTTGVAVGLNWNLNPSAKPK